MSSNNTTCDLSPTYCTAQSNAAFFAVYVVVPLHITLGLPGHILSLFAYYKSSKEEAAYGYQIIAAVSETLELLARALFVWIVKLWSGIEGNGAMWYMQNYPLMWYAARCTPMLSNWMITNTILLLASMAADRTFALARPFVYKNIKHRRHQVAAVCVCTVISFLTSFFDTFRYIILDQGDRYKIIADQTYAQLPAVFALTQLRNFVRAAGAAATIGLNITVIRLYLLQSKKVTVLTGNNDSKERKRKANAKVLIILTLSQGFFCVLSVSLSMAYFTAINTVAGFASRGAGLFSSIVSAASELGDVIQFYFVFLVSKQFRMMILKSVKREATNLVSNISARTVPVSQRSQNA